MKAWAVAIKVSREHRRPKLLDVWGWGLQGGYRVWNMICYPNRNTSSHITSGLSDENWNQCPGARWRNQMARQRVRLYPFFNILSIPWTWRYEDLRTFITVSNDDNWSHYLVLVMFVFTLWEPYLVLSVSFCHYRFGLVLVFLSKYTVPYSTANTTHYPVAICFVPYPCW